MTKHMFFSTVAFLALLGTANAQDKAWKYSGSMYILTTSQGADLPAAASEKDFPLLVRLDKGFFDFRQAKANGEDIRFSTSTGADLPYQIDRWDAAKGAASIWVRIPAIKGNARQEIKLRWGKADAASESSGKAVFNESNGYCGVWHMNDPVQDELAAVTSTDKGTTATAGMIGAARNFPGGQGIFCGEKIESYPSGDNPSTTEAWFRTDKSNTTIIGWGKEGGRGGKVRMQFRSPPHIHIDSDFSDVWGESTLPFSQWIHVVHTYGNGEARVYINGRLDGATKPFRNILSPARLWIGGWYNNYDFVGDIDEVRISKVARSADWIRLQYENQKPLQTLVGPVVQPGDAFAVSQTRVTLPEGKSVTLTGKAGGAQKVYWIVRKDGAETVAAVDRFAFDFDAGRVAGDKSATIQFKAVYANGIKTQDIAVTIKEAIPDPIFTLNAPASWDGRKTIQVSPKFANKAQIIARGAGTLKYAWTVSDIAVIKEIVPGKLILKRAQNSGNLAVTLSVSNGGAEIVSAATIVVKEPAKDAWVQRKPGKDEKLSDNQFIAREDGGEGTLYCSGTLAEPADSVFLRIYADDKPYKPSKVEGGRVAADRSYALSAKIKAGLVKYKVELVAKRGGREAVLQTVNNVVCGDAYMIDGQSNALATDWGQGDHLDTSEWIRSFGSNGGDVSKGWGNAVRRQGGHWQIGCWAMDLAILLVERQKMPICIINGAAGGTLIEVHQRNPMDHTDKETIYGRLLNRIQQARLAHGIRGVFWHQGENNQGTQGATGRYGWETYEQYFVDMSAAWKEDYPNIQHYYTFQIWPNSCSMGGTWNSDKLRDVQRTLPRLYSNMSVISTLGVRPPGPCHFPPAGYADMARRLVCPQVERYNHGTVFDKPVTPANIKKAHYTSGKKDEIVLEFDQPMTWTDSLTSQFYLDRIPDQVAAGKASGRVITLKLKAPSTAGKIAYLKDSSWSLDKLLYGANGIAALTFCDVPIGAAQ